MVIEGVLDCGAGGRDGGGGAAAGGSRHNWRGIQQYMITGRRSQHRTSFRNLVNVLCCHLTDRRPAATAVVGQEAIKISAITTHHPMKVLTRRQPPSGADATGSDAPPPLTPHPPVNQKLCDGQAVGSVWRPLWPHVGRVRRPISPHQQPPLPTLHAQSPDYGVRRRLGYI